MNGLLTNATFSCPMFLAVSLNATVSYCALPLCANITAVMAQCCAGSEVVPYHSAGGPDSGNNKITDLNALWCQVDDSSAPAWLDCTSAAHGSVGLCSASSSEQKGWASQSIVTGTTGLKTTVGLAVMIAMFYSIL